MSEKSTANNEMLADALTDLSADVAVAFAKHLPAIGELHGNDTVRTLNSMTRATTLALVGLVGSQAEDDAGMPMEVCALAVTDMVLSAVSGLMKVGGTVPTFRPNQEPGGDAKAA